MMVAVSGYSNWTLPLYTCIKFATLKNKFLKLF